MLLNCMSSLYVSLMSEPYAHKHSWTVENCLVFCQKWYSWEELTIREYWRIWYVGDWCNWGSYYDSIAKRLGNVRKDPLQLKFIITKAGITEVHSSCHFHLRPPCAFMMAQWIKWQATELVAGVDSQQHAVISEVVTISRCSISNFPWHQMQRSKRLAVVCGVICWSAQVYLLRPFLL